MATCVGGYCQTSSGGVIFVGTPPKFLEDGTGVVPPDGTWPLYRIASTACPYNSYTDTTSCKCIKYTSIFQDYYTVCVNAAGQAAYFWTHRDDCSVLSTFAGENIPLINAPGHVDSTTGNQYCFGVVSSGQAVDNSILSMPVVGKSSNPGSNTVVSSPIGSIVSSATSMATTSETVTSAGVASTTNKASGTKRLRGKGNIKISVLFIGVMSVLACMVG